MARRVVLTRPAQEAGGWQQRLGEAGHEVHLLPLIDIVPLPADHGAADVLARCDAVMWVSASAVRAFFGQWAGREWPAGLRCWAPGPGTARALQEAGVPPGLIDQPAAGAPQFDSEALWAVVGDQVHPGHRLLLVRGLSEAARAAGMASSGREWLARQCEAAGGQVRALPVYERRCPVWDPATQARARALLAPDAIWLFSSGEAAGHLRQLLPDGAWRDVPALATHPRIAQTLAALGWQAVRTVRPEPEAVLRALAGD